MKSRIILPLFALCAMFALTADAKAGLLDRMLGGGCCQPSCCETTCAAAEPACGCAAAPTCCAAPACEPTCGCAPSCDSGCGKCCRPTPVRDFLAGLHCKMHSLRDRCKKSCCESSCCEATCGCAAEPACGCAAEPACGCAN